MVFGKNSHPQLGETFFVRDFLRQSELSERGIRLVSQDVHDAVGYLSYIRFFLADKSFCSSLKKD